MDCENIGPRCLSLCNYCWTSGCQTHEKGMWLAKLSLSQVSESHSPVFCRTYHSHYTGLFTSPWNTLENWLMPQLNEDSNDYILQHDGSPAHYKDVRGYLNRNLPQMWIGRTGKEDEALMRWPSRSPALTPCDFSFWGVCEGHRICASTPR